MLEKFENYPGDKLNYLPWTRYGSIEFWANEEEGYVLIRIAERPNSKATLMLPLKDWMAMLAEHWMRFSEHAEKKISLSNGCPKCGAYFEPASQSKISCASGHRFTYEVSPGVVTVKAIDE
jgi:hypothetical protein